MTVQKNASPPTLHDIDEIVRAFEPVLAVMRRFAEQVIDLTRSPTVQALLRASRQPAYPPIHYHARRWRRRTYAARRHPDAMRLDASCAEADAELAEWRALLDGAKGRR